MRDVRVSELSLWLKCRRRTWLQYEEGYGSESLQMGIGTAFHHLIAEYHDPDFVPEEAVTLTDPDALATVDAMFTTYVTEVESQGLDVGQRTVDVERRFHEMIGGVTLTGQVDHIYFCEIAGCYVIQDTKTGNFFETAQRDFQLMTYAWLARQAGIEVGAVEHNIVKRNKRTSRAKPPYIQRNRHYVSAEEIEKWGDILAYIILDYVKVMDLARNTDGAKHPMLWAKGTNDCSWWCQFSDICGMIDDPEADVSGVLETEFVKREEEPQP